MYLIMRDTCESSFHVDSPSEARFWASFPSYVVMNLATRELILN